MTIDSGLTFNQHVDYICKTSAYHIRSLRHIRKFIDTDASMSVATALVGARVDYCNSLLYGTSKRNIDKLQRLQNSLARAVTGTGASEHIKPVLKKLHWLPITARIHYKNRLTHVQSDFHPATGISGWSDTTISADKNTATLISSSIGQ